MSDSEGNPDPLSDWMIMEEVVDGDSEASESSIEVVNIEGQEAVSFRCRLDRLSSNQDEDEKESEKVMQSPEEAVPFGAQVVETDGGLGACCMELVIMSGAEKETDEALWSNEEAPLSVQGDEPGISINCDRAEDGKNDDDDDSGEESDFICLDANNSDEVNGNNNNSNNNNNNNNVAEPLPRVVLMERSTSSIGPGFNFFRHHEDPVMHPDDEPSDRDSIADLDDDTESSVEDAVDDRIESEQSEVGSVQAQNDVGDLSAFADIGDLPLEVGNVARNYIHRPNNRVSTLLNTTVVLAAILTMGISLGIIMAGDLEIEEWQRAYDGQVKKSLQIEDRLFKAELNHASFEEVFTFFTAAEKPGEPVSTFLTSMRTVVDAYTECKEERRYLPSHDCQSTIVTDVQKAVAAVKGQDHNEKYTSSDSRPSHGSGETMADTPPTELEDSVVGMERKTGRETFIHKETRDSKALEFKVKHLQQSLAQEKERSLRWQQQYLHERRLRERERENEALEDQRERALWEKQDEEEDLRLRQQWEKEEEEEDRLERLRWEQEEAEEDRKDRERWEHEKAHLTFHECFKVMSANLTGLAQNVLNTSRMHDFANLTMLMSSVAELKESVVQSVKQLKKSAEVVFTDSKKDEGESNKSDEEEPFFNHESVSKYLQGALKGLKSEVNNILNVRDVKKEEHEEEKETKAQFDPKDDGESGFSGPKKHHSDSIHKWQKALKNLFKMTSKSLRRFGKEIVHQWKKVKSALKGQKSHHQDMDKMSQFSSFSSELVNGMCEGLYLPDQASQDIKNIATISVDIGCQCVENVRDTWYKAVHSNPCQILGIYSYACNIDPMILGQEIKLLRKTLEKLLKKDFIIHAQAPLVSAIGYKARRKRLEELQDFWDAWGDHELLMKQDKEWTRCRLKWWSSVMKDGQPQEEDSCRSVTLYALFEGLVGKDTQRSFSSNPTDSADSHMSSQETAEENTGNERSDFDILEELVPEDNSENILNTFNEEIDQIHVSDLDNDKEDGGEDGNDLEDHDEDKGKQEKEGFEFDPEHVKNEIEANDTLARLDSLSFHDKDVGDGENQFSMKDWLLERAQLRLQLRRDKEKVSWVLERAAQREMLRNQDEESLSDWSLEKGKLRDAFRKRDHEADWVFDRAKQRREKHQSKWARDFRGKDAFADHHSHDGHRRTKFHEEWPQANEKLHRKAKMGQKWHKKGEKMGKKHRKHSEKNFKKQHGGRKHKKEKHNNRKKGKFGFQNIKRFAKQVFAAFLP